VGKEADEGRWPLREGYVEFGELEDKLDVGKSTEMTRPIWF
jgi:hypothetical protein